MSALPRYSSALAEIEGRMSRCGVDADAMTVRAVQLRLSNTAKTPKASLPTITQSGSPFIIIAPHIAFQHRQVSTGAMDVSSITSGQNDNRHI